MTDPFTDFRMWCPECGHLLANNADGWSGVCPSHGSVSGTFVAPLVVVDENGVQGRFVRRSETGNSVVAMTDGIEVHLLASGADVIQADKVSAEEWSC